MPLYSWMITVYVSFAVTMEGSQTPVLEFSFDEEEVRDIPQ